MAAGAEVEIVLSKKGAKAGVGAEAVVVSGEVSGTVSLFGIEVTASVGAGVGAAAGAKAQIGEVDAKKGSVASAKVKLGAPLFGSVGLKFRKE